MTHFYFTAAGLLVLLLVYYLGRRSKIPAIPVRGVRMMGWELGISARLINPTTHPVAVDSVFIYGKKLDGQGWIFRNLYYGSVVPSEVPPKSTATLCFATDCEALIANDLEWFCVVAEWKDGGTSQSLAKRILRKTNPTGPGMMVKLEDHPKARVPTPVLSKVGREIMTWIFGVK